MANMTEPIDLSELERLSEAATPGPWVADRPWLSRGLMHVDGVMPRANLHPEEPYLVKTVHNHGSCSYAKHVAEPAHGHSAEDNSDVAKNMDYIAAANPETIKSLALALRLADEALGAVVYEIECTAIECDVCIIAKSARAEISKLVKIT